MTVGSGNEKEKNNDGGGGGSSSLLGHTEGGNSLDQTTTTSNTISTRQRRCHYPPQGLDDTIENDRNDDEGDNHRISVLLNFNTATKDMKSHIKRRNWINLRWWMIFWNCRICRPFQHLISSRCQRQCEQRHQKIPKLQIRAHQQLQRRRLWMVSTILFVLFLVLLYPIMVVYRIYKAETLPSPFLKNSLLSTQQRGVAPPSNIFEFPTPTQRIQFYMGYWYNVTSNETLVGTTTTTTTIGDHEQQHKSSSLSLSPLCTQIPYWTYGMSELGSPYRFISSNLRQLIYVGWYYRFPWRPQRSHPGDAYLYHFHTVDEQYQQYHSIDGSNTNNHDSSNNKAHETTRRQMILQFGDGKDSANFLSTPYPIMVKTRLSQSIYDQRYGHHDENHPPIIGMYEIHRHYNDHFYETDQLWDVIPWSSKINKLIWRGTSSGKRKDFIVPYMDHQRSNSRSNNNNNVDVDGNMVDIGFSSILKIHQNKFSQPDSFYTKPELSLPELLRHKYLLVLEGWGMASSLKWMLFSNSVVFMVPPTKVSWAMEDQLLPYVHYIPINANFTNLQEQLVWAQSHDEECYQIMLQSRHYMERLVTSPQAQQETIEILTTMDRIYQENFGSILQSCPTT